MDPDETLRLFDAAMTERNREDVAIYADALVGWLAKDGFSPFQQDSIDWRGKLTKRQLISYFRNIRAVAEMT